MWYEEFDEKKDKDIFLGFELNGNTISRYKPVGITWNDSFCRNLGIWFHRSIKLYIPETDAYNVLKKYQKS